MTTFKCINCGKVLEDKRDNIINCPLCLKDYLCEMSEEEISIYAALDSNFMLLTMLNSPKEEII